ncbi:MAG TPA: hypothetical protein DCE41_18455 [Cytophagales bacterium]|nr:hypothetical protein [Cytophagales bacterium]HAA19491.1 hypothetical protein [Cytophagales bacterium]HAP59634.1 hypothetical protein [Cytophagales bacterium]
MRTLLFVLCIFQLSVGLSQATPDSLASAQLIDEQVWHPFQESWSARDAAAFNSIHTDKVVRAGNWGIRVGEEYKEQNRRSFARPNSAPRTIDFTFAMREFHEAVAYEVGYYRVTMRPDDGPERVSYGYFHVVLRKEDGVWKIAQDWDANEVGGHAIGAAEFATGFPLSAK